MPPRSVHRALATRLQSIRDVAHDLGSEISRTEGHRAVIGDMVERIERDVADALKLLERYALERRDKG